MEKPRISLFLERLPSHIVLHDKNQRQLNIKINNKKIGWISSNVGDLNCQTVAAEIHRHTVHSCHCHLLCSNVRQSGSKAKSAELGSPASVCHCPVVFAKDHVKLMVIIRS